MEGRGNLQSDDALADPLTPADQPDETRSIADDIGTLIEDARTYLDAELSYQKSRAGFVADRLKRTLAMGALAACILVFALFGLIFGLILALTPLLTAWGATAVVVLAMLIVAWLLLRKAGAAWNQMLAAMKDNSEERDDG
ncbi:MAG: phage holin family protein [Erythrobacter sp.]|nr:phage holin family protein [Erythrobacter sp.]